VNWIQLAYDCVQWLTIVNSAMKLLKKDFFHGISVLVNSFFSVLLCGVYKVYKAYKVKLVSPVV
jgi:hypothetical protein